MNYTDTKIWLNRYRNIKHKISHAEAMIDGLIKDQALISKYETGERVPPTDALLILANFYNVSIDYILCRTDNPEIKR